jgi:hypothetical protein
MERSGDNAAFRTLFIAPESDELEVRTRIQSALRSSDEWLVRFNRARPLRFDERALATQLAQTPQEESARPRSSFTRSSTWDPTQR